MAINNVRTEPGVFSQFQPTRTFPVTSGGARVVALLGKGKTTNKATGEVVTKGSLDATDSLENTAVALDPTVVDEDLNTYKITDDYILDSGGVAWSPASQATLTGTLVENYDMTGNVILKITVGGGVEQVVDIGDSGTGSGQYASPAAATATEVAAVIDTEFDAVGLGSDLDVDKVRITTDDGNNTSILIGDGDANITLGFTGGTFLQTPREPAPGKTYQVSYDFDKVSDDYVPRFFFDMSSVIAEHGDVSAANTLSHGAEIVFQQGASLIVLIQLDPSGGAELTQFRSALTKLENVEGINIVVPLTTNASLYPDVVNHVDTMSSTTERKERTAIIAMVDPKTPQEIATQAKAIANKRIVLHNITQADRFIGNDANITTLDGSFVSAALGGIRTSVQFDVADSLTRKEITGFDALRPTDLLRSERVFMLDNGVCVINVESGINRVVQGITTDTSTVENQEYSTVEIIDFVAINMRQVLESIYIGQKILSGTTSQVKSTVQAVLGNLVTSEILTAFQSVQASVDGTDPTQINVSFEIAPVFPLNFILITFSLAPNQ